MNAELNPRGLQYGSNHGYVFNDAFVGIHLELRWL
jgi:hypothetical protein